MIACLRSFSAAARTSRLLTYAHLPVRAMSTRITKHNFQHKLPEVLRSIADADFVALDTELTGLRASPFATELPYDNVVSRFAKLRHSASHISVLQFGISSFKFDEDARKFRTYTYSFYLNPRLAHPVNEKGSDTLMAAEVSALNFLGQHNFDFTASFLDGISFLSMEEERVKRKQLLQAIGYELAGMEQCHRNPTRTIFTTSMPNAIERGEADVILLPSNAELTIATSLIDEVRGYWHALKAAESPCIVEHYTVDGIVQLFRCVKTPPLSRAQQRYLKVIVNDPEFERNLLCYVDDRDQHAPDDKKVFRVVLVDKEFDFFMKYLFSERVRRAEEQLQALRGFRVVIDALIENGKPLVGHNCALDIFHTFAKFLAPIPLSLRDFNATWTSHFPTVFDTKFILRENICANTEWKALFTSLGSTGLEQVYSEVMSNKYSSLRVDVVDGNALGDGSVAVEMQAHDAGFDAYMTGAVFAQLALPVGHFLGWMDGSIAAARNKLHLMRVVDPSQRTLVLDTYPSSCMKVTPMSEWGRCVAWCTSASGCFTSQAAMNLLVRSIALHLEIRPQLIERRSNIHVLNGFHCLIELPSAAHAELLAKTYGRSDLTDTSTEDTAPKLDESGLLSTLLAGGDNMLGIPAVSTVSRASGIHAGAVSIVERSTINELLAAKLDISNPPSLQDDCKIVLHAAFIDCHKDIFEPVQLAIAEEETSKGDGAPVTAPPANFTALTSTSKSSTCRMM